MATLNYIKKKGFRNKIMEWGIESMSCWYLIGMD